MTSFNKDKKVVTRRRRNKSQLDLLGGKWRESGICHKGNNSPIR